MREDAERNRQKLIETASEIMRNEGGEVPMELIAERANLTRGTLYRNFPHRQAIYEAVLENDLGTMPARLAHFAQPPARNGYLNILARQGLVDGAGGSVRAAHDPGDLAYAFEPIVQAIRNRITQVDRQ